MNILKQVAIVSKRLIYEFVFSARFNPAIFPEVNICDYEEYHDSGAVGVCPLRVRLILDFIEPNSTILDVGCGKGLLAKEIEKAKKVQIHGIDVSANAIVEFAEKGFHGEVRNIDEEGLNLKSTYDYTLLVEVLEHLKWPHKVLIEACEHSRKGVIVTLPNSGYIRWRLQMLRGYAPRQSFTHLHFWSINDFDLFLKMLGLRVVNFRSDLTGRINHAFDNLLAYQQCWLIAPRHYISERDQK
jgi:methionine biosynthesis protein MetW